MIPVLLEGLTVPRHGAFWENIVMFLATAVWRHKFLGTTERLYEYFLFGVWRKIYRENVNDEREQSCTRPLHEHFKGLF